MHQSSAGQGGVKSAAYTYSLPPSDLSCYDVHAALQESVNLHQHVPVGAIVSADVIFRLSASQKARCYPRLHNAGVVQPLALQVKDNEEPMQDPQLMQEPMP